jgi:hypothetical protein
MAANRDVMTDAGGKPRARLWEAGEDARRSFCLLLVDMSAIGMPTNTPLHVSSHEGDTFLTWYLGRTPLAHTPKALSAKEAAESINMDVLLAAHRRLVKAESGR